MRLLKLPSSFHRQHASKAHTCNAALGPQWPRIYSLHLAMLGRTMPDAKVIALRTDWMISPAVYSLEVRITENGDTEVEADVELLNGSARLAVLFRAGQWERVWPADRDESTLPRSRFDLSSIPAAGITVTGSYVDHFRELWTQNGACPDPGIYEVIDSTWLAETNAARFGCRHFVLRGRDMW